MPNLVNIKMKPNVLFLVIDSFRADKCYGNKKTSLTPNIDSLIRNGVYFNQAISASDGTFTSLGSIFTSLIPFRTHISWFNNHSKATKYFDFLKNNGYYTYATVPNMPFFPNLTTNFDDKDITVGYPYLHLYEGTAEKIVNRLELGAMKEPWIYYIHIMDLHGNEFPQTEFNDERYGINDYERRVSSIDFWIGKILEKINLKNTLVVLTADHGEHVHDLASDPEYIPSIQKIFRNVGSKAPSFLRPVGLKLFVSIRSIIKKIRMKQYKRTLNEDELRTLIQRGGGTLYDEVLRIPLIFSGNGIESHKMISQQVRHVDIFPTIVELIGLSFNEKVDGVSLLPLINNETIDEKPAYIENVSSIEEILGDIIGVRTSEYKYYRARNNPKENLTLFDLKNDLDEKNNTASSNSSIVEKIEKILIEITKDTIKENNQNTLNTQKLSQEEIKKAKEVLRELGYD